jgi:hypothetical protein
VARERLDPLRERARALDPIVAGEVLEQRREPPAAADRVVDRAQPRAMKRARRARGRRTPLGERRPRPRVEGGGILGRAAAAPRRERSLEQRSRRSLGHRRSVCRTRVAGPGVRTAKWAARPIELGGGNQYRPTRRRDITIGIIVALIVVCTAIAWARSIARRKPDLTPRGHPRSSAT